MGLDATTSNLSSKAKNIILQAKIQGFATIHYKVLQVLHFSPHIKFEENPNDLN